jgi:hypothetical protein
LKQAQPGPTISKVTATAPPPELPSIPCKSWSFEQQLSFLMVRGPDWH